MTVQAAANSASTCGLVNQSPYVIVKTFSTSVSGTNYNLVLLRDPSGNAGPNAYTGEWNKNSNKWTASTISAIGFNDVDPTNTVYIN